MLKKCTPEFFIYASQFSFFNWISILVLWSVFRLLFVVGVDMSQWQLASHPKEKATALGLVPKADKLRGVHYFGRFQDRDFDFREIAENNIKQIVLVPYGHQEAYNHPALNFRNRGRRMSIDRDSLYGVIARKANESGLEVIVKPQIWMNSENGKWITDIHFGDEKQFDIWARNYSDFILHYAILSEKIGATHFCIGTELTQLTKNHAGYWRRLIAEVRLVYSGKIFYAANWYNDYDQITFWQDLDLIGVQAYFPICKKENPQVEDLIEGWKLYHNRLKNLSEKYNKPILFSELGYRSSHDAAAEPWEWVDGPNSLSMKLSPETQANCYEAFFRTFWNEPWFSGALIWQWQTRYENDPLSTKTNLDFTPQHKPAQKVMAKWFGY